MFEQQQQDVLKSTMYREEEAVCISTRTEFVDFVFDSWRSASRTHYTPKFDLLARSRCPLGRLCTESCFVTLSLAPFPVLFACQL